jgi:hypothetical protein
MTHISHSSPGQMLGSAFGVPAAALTISLIALCLFVIFAA